MAVNQSFLGNMTPLSANVPAVKKPAVLTPAIVRPPGATPPKPTTPSLTPVSNNKIVTPSTFMDNPAVRATIDNNLNFGGIKPTEDQVNQAVQARIKDMQAKVAAGEAVVTPSTTGTTTTTTGTTGAATTSDVPGGGATGGTTPGSGASTTIVAPTTSDYTTDEEYKKADAARASAASEQFKAEEYAKREQEAVSALQQKYARLRADAMTRSQNQSAERFSNLAGVGVNPLSSGAANVAGDVERNLANEMSNIAMQEASEIAATKSALRGERNAEAEKALNLATSAMERIRQSALDRQAASQQSFQNTMARAKFLADESRSNYDFSQKQKDDAAAEIETMIEGSVDAIKTMTPEQKAALEKRAGWLVGAIDSRIKKAEEKAKKDEASTKAKALVEQDKRYMEEGYLPVVGPSDLAKLPSGSKITRGDNGRIYYLPPEKEKYMNVGAGGTVFDPNTGKVVYTAPKSSGGGGGSKKTTLEKNYDRYVQDQKDRNLDYVSFGDFVDKKGMNTGTGGGLDIDALSDDLMKD